jgi:serralysin
MEPFDTVAGATATSFSDTTLTGGDTITYMVTASNSLGTAADSNIPAVVQTSPSIHVGDLDSIASGNRNLVAKAITIVHNDSDSPMSGVLVEGLWDDGVSSNSATCTTDGTGQCTMNKNTKEVSITFTVTNLVLSGFESNLSANHDPDGDSDGTTIIISKDGLPDPTLSINDVSQAEGDSGTTIFTFTISRTGSTVGDVTVDWDTGDGSATTTDNDYVASTGNTATILAGTSSVDITVLVNGDTNDEGNEQFVVDLSNPTGATISDSQGVGTIENDDVAPTLSINDVSQAEGDSGTTIFTFTISRTGDTVGAVDVGWETVDASATTGDNDYDAASGTATIFDGNPSVEITVLVNGDTTPEDDENFFVNLVSSDGPAISDSQGVGTIENDDVDPSALSITSIDNNFGSPGETIIVTLTGTAFDPTANITLENGSGKTPTVNTSSITDTEIILAVVISDKGTKIGDWELTVTNPDGNSDFVIFSIVP